MKSYITLKAGKVTKCTWFVRSVMSLFLRVGTLVQPCGMRTPLWRGIVPHYARYLHSVFKSKSQQEAFRCDCFVVSCVSNICLLQSCCWCLSASLQCRLSLTILNAGRVYDICLGLAAEPAAPVRNPEHRACWFSVLKCLSSYKRTCRAFTEPRLTSRCFCLAASLEQPACICAQCVAVLDCPGLATQLETDCHVCGLDLQQNPLFPLHYVPAASLLCWSPTTPPTWHTTTMVEGRLQVAAPDHALGPPMSLVYRAV